MINESKYFVWVNVWLWAAWQWLWFSIITVILPFLAGIPLSSCLPSPLALHSLDPTELYILPKLYHHSQSSPKLYRCSLLPQSPQPDPPALAKSQFALEEITLMIVPSKITVKITRTMVWRRYTLFPGINSFSKDAYGLTLEQPDASQFLLRKEEYLSIFFSLTIASKHLEKSGIIRDN